MITPGSSGRFPFSLTLLFVLCLALTGVGAVALVLASSELARSSQEVEHSLQVQNTLESLQLALVDAEAGQRGFLVTGRPHFLEPYIDAVAKQAYYLGSLERQVANEPLRAQAVQALRPLVDELLGQIAATLAEARNQHGEPSIAAMNASKAAMDRVRAAMEGMRGFEQRSLAQRRLEVDQRTRYALIVLLVSNAASVLGLAVLYIGMRSYERKRREGQAELVRREEEYRSLFHGSPLGEAECDPQSSRFLRANRRLCDMTGLDEAALQRTSLFDLLPRVNHLDNARAYRDVVSGQREVVRLEQPIGRADGSTVHAEILVVAVRNAEGTVDRTSVVIQDVTTRKDTEARDAEAQRVLKAIAHNTRNLVSAKDLDGRHVFVNEALQGALERPESEILGQTDDALFPEACARALREADLRVLTARAPVTTEETLVFAREARTYIVNRAPFLDADGTVLGVICIATDVTELSGRTRPDGRGPGEPPRRQTAALGR